MTLVSGRSRRIFSRAEPSLPDRSVDLCASAKVVTYVGQDLIPQQATSKPHALLKRVLTGEPCWSTHGANGPPPINLSPGASFVMPLFLFYCVSFTVVRSTARSASIPPVFIARSNSKRRSCTALRCSKEKPRAWVKAFCATKG